MQRQVTAGSTRIWMTAVIALAAIAVASCASTAQQPGGGPTSARSSGQASPGSSSTSPTGTSTVPVSCQGGWLTGPLTVTHTGAVPPVPIVADIRTGSHPQCRYDRVVIDVNGFVPGFSAHFVAKVIQDGSGQPVVMPGTRFLVIRLSPAQGHTAAGKLTLPQRVQVLSYPMLKSYAVSGDFEGVLSIALGLAGGTRYRVGELPGKIYIDVAW